MSRRYFYEEDGELCYGLDSIKDMIADDFLEEKEVWLAKRMTGEDFAWCTHYAEPLMKGEGTCGKVCDHYKPRNGKSGICNHQGYCYEPVEKVLIKL